MEHTGTFDYLHLLGYNIIKFDESQPVFGGTCRLNILGLIIRQAGRKHSSACYPLHVGFLFGIFLEPEDGGDTFFRNAG
jgi:hypothetical protein